MFQDIFNQFVIVKLPLYLKFSVQLSCCHVAKGNTAKRERRGRIGERNRQRRSTSVERFVISNCDN